MNLAKITARYVGRPFAEYGCLELVVSVLRDLGKDMPKEIDGITLANYRALVDANISHAQGVMLNAFRKIGKPASTRYPYIGDLLVVSQRHRNGSFPAVALGNNLAIASFIRKGVCVFELDNNNLPIMARRID